MTNDRKFMEAAVAEMLRSRSEHSNKVDPLVGAVLVSAEGEELARACRGKLRDGDHAEYTLIERYLRDRSLEGASIYVTLEPCTKRRPPKKPCSHWVVKSRIGRVFIGMTDPNPDICGRGIQYLLDHGVDVVFFDADLGLQIREANRDFIAYYENAEQEDDEGDFEGPSRQEREVVGRARLDDLSSDALSQYNEERKLDLRVPSEELWRHLERAGYLGRTAGLELAPTLAGVVLFAEQPADILPQCRVSMEARRAGRTVSGDFEGPLMAFRDHLDSFVRDNMRHFVEIRGMDRVEEGEYPIEAIREAALNAVVHRDYRAGARVHIVLGETSLEVRSPGGLLRPLSLTRVRSFNAPPYSRNPHIALAVQRMGWIEEKGSGLASMREAMLGRRLRPPMFDLRGGYFVVTLLGEDQAWHNVRVDPGLLGGLESIQQQIVQHLLEAGEIATRDCVKRFGISDGTARNHLRQLRELGIIEPRGAGPKRRYVLAGT